MSPKECDGRISILRADALYHEGLKFKAHKDYPKSCGKFSAALRKVRILMRDGHDWLYQGKPITDFYHKVYTQMVRTSALRKKAACFG